jgi:hypothetical protein
MKFKMILLLAAFFAPLFVLAQTPYTMSIVAGQQQKIVDLDQNGYPDAGITYVGHFKMVYAYDMYNRYYFFDGLNTYTNVGSVDALDKTTRVVQEYNITYNVDFGNTGYPVKGWYRQSVVCKGYQYPNGGAVYVYLTVHRTDPRFNGESLVFGDWQQFVLVWSKHGNIPRNWNFGPLSKG